MNKGKDMGRRWTIWRCPECGEPTLAKAGFVPGHVHNSGFVPAEEVEVIPADSPQVLSVDEAKLLIGEANDDNDEMDALFGRLSDFAAEQEKP